MSSVNYWNSCKKCKTEIYGRHRQLSCPICKGEIDSITEYDEDFAEQDAEERASKFKFNNEDY